MTCGRPRIATAIRGLATAGSGAAQPNPSDGAALLSPGWGMSRPVGGGPAGRFRSAAAAAAALVLSGCAATQSAAAVETGAPGFLLGVWHGFIFPVAFIISLFTDSVAVYAVPNSGGWYDFGYFVGIVFIGVGARGTRTVYRDRVVDRSGNAGPVVDGQVIDSKE